MFWAVRCVMFVLSVMFSIGIVSRLCTHRGFQRICVPACCFTKAVATVCKAVRKMQWLSGQRAKIQIAVSML